MTPRQALQLKRNQKVWFGDLHCSVNRVSVIYHSPHYWSLIDNFAWLGGSLASLLPSQKFRLATITGTIAYQFLAIDSWLGRLSGTSDLVGAYLDLEYQNLDQELNYYADFISVNCTEVHLEEPIDAD